MAFNLFKKKKEGIPEIGEEYLGEDTLGKDQINSFSDNQEYSEDENQSNEIEKPLKKEENTKFKKRNIDIRNTQNNYEEKPSRVNDFKLNIDSSKLDLLNSKLEKLDSRIESLSEFIKDYSERFSNLNQQIGELRSSSLSNEKSISKISAEASKAISIVSDVHPENLKIDYQKLENKIEGLSQKIEMNRETFENINKELNEFRKKSEIFIGTEGILDLNNELKKDILEVQKLASKTRLHADKVENVFLEITKGFSEIQKNNEMIKLLDKNYSGLKKDVESNKINLNNYTKKEDFEKLRASFNLRTKLVEDALNDFEKIKIENRKLAELIENTFLLEKQNSKRLALFKGKDIEVSTEYDKRLDSILDVIENLTLEVKRLKFNLDNKNLKNSILKREDNFPLRIVQKKQITQKNK